MEILKNDSVILQNEEKSDLYMLLKEGINDMEEGRELPLREAFEQMREHIDKEL